MPESLYTALDSIRKDLLIHLDDEDHLSIPTAKALLRVIENLLGKSAKPSDVTTENPAWRHLVSAFEVGYEIHHLHPQSAGSKIMSGEGPTSVGDLTTSPSRCSAIPDFGSESSQGWNCAT